MKKGLFGVTSFGSLILGILAVVFLGFLAVKLVYFFIDQETRNAASFMNELEAKVNNLEDGQNNTFAMRGVDGWILVGWNKDVDIVGEDETINSTKKPQECFDKNCLCLCPESISQCNLNAQCRFFDREVLVSSEAYIDVAKYYRTSIAKGDGKFYASCLYFDKQLKPIRVTKNLGEIGVVINYGDLTQETYESLVNSFDWNLCGNYKNALNLTW